MTRFHAIVAGRNAAPWAPGCLESLMSQVRPFDSVQVIDDASTDDTWEAILDWTDGRNDLADVHVSRNLRRRGALANQCRMIDRAKPWPEDVLVFVDLDDRLAHPGVLLKLESIYSNIDVECTYGNYRPEPFSPTCARATPYPKSVISSRSFREDAMTGGGLRTNHLRTFRYRPFSKIDQDVNFKWPDGQWFQVATDTAMMIPVLELAKEHRHLNEELYLYNSANPSSDWRTAAEEIDRTHGYILRELKPLVTTHMSLPVEGVK